MAPQSKTQLLIVDDHEVVRLGLKVMLADTEIKVVGDVASGQEAVKFVSEKEVDVVLLDVRMPDGDGLNTLGRIKLDKPDLGILMFSFSDNPTYVARAVAMGANGYLLKNCSHDELIHAVKSVAAGESLWTRDELRRVSGAMATPRLTADVEVALTQRESEVLRQLALGLTNEQIAEAMHISYETIKEHVQHILRKIGVTDRTQAAVWAVRANLV
jgi:DNA-binding NarL/FixJ family response regulator